MTFLEKEPGLADLTGRSAGRLAWVIEHGVDSVAIGVKTATNKLLILTDVYYDSWQVDGGRANRRSCCRSYGAFRAVAVPAGSQPGDVHVSSQNDTRPAD